MAEHQASAHAAGCFPLYVFLVEGTKGDSSPPVASLIPTVGIKLLQVVK